MLFEYILFLFKCFIRLSSVTIHLKRNVAHYFLSEG